MSSCHFLTFTGAFYAGVFRSLLLIVLLLLTNTWYMLALSPDSCGLFAGLRRLGSMCSGEDNSCHSSSTPFMAKKTDWLDSFAYYDTEFNMNFCISVGTGNWCFGYGLGYGDTDEESSELYLFGHMLYTFSQSATTRQQGSALIFLNLLRQGWWINLGLDLWWLMEIRLLLIQI